MMKQNILKNTKLFKEYDVNNLLQISQKITFVILLAACFIIPIYNPAFAVNIILEPIYIAQVLITVMLIGIYALIQIIFFAIAGLILEWLFGETIVSEFIWMLNYKFVGDEYLPQLKRTWM